MLSQRRKRDATGRKKGINSETNDAETKEVRMVAFLNKIA